MTIRKAVLPVAGLGTRLLPATKSQPKEMLPLGYKPVIQYVVDEMMSQGMKQFLFVTSRKKRSIEDYFDDDPELSARLAAKDQSIDEVDYEAEGVHFFYARQRRAAGNGDAVRLAAEFVGSESFVVGFGDTIIHSPHHPQIIDRLVASHERHGASATIGVCEVPRSDTSKYGVVQPVGELGDDFAIEDLVEKPRPEEAPSCLAVAARYVFTADIFAALEATEPGIGGELWLADAIRVLLTQGKTVRCVRMKPGERRYDIGTPLTYYQAFVDFALGDPQYGEEFCAYLQEKLGGMA
jgi:UTP--glucose-1-phosphate uridylyltransferase